MKTPRKHRLTLPRGEETISILITLHGISTKCNIIITFLSNTGSNLQKGRPI